MSVLTVIKICHDKKQMKIYLEQKRLEELEQKRREEMGSEDEEPVQEEVNEGPQVSCEKISEEEYDFQSRVLTKQEIRRLVNSDVYKRLLEVNGNDPANWNW